MTRHNEFQDPPEVCAARAADPAWVAEQATKRDAASERFADRRDAIGLTLVAKKHGERFG